MSATTVNTVSARVNWNVLTLTRVDGHAARARGVPGARAVQRAGLTGSFAAALRVIDARWPHQPTLQRLRTDLSACDLPLQVPEP
ncbi:MAG: hypothetical protein JWO79_4368 [Actinomycetia bacterium]|nr:hypothetical protein [Actinomycetes bacterium]